MKIFSIFAVLLCGGLLIYGMADFPDWGDPNSPASTHVSPTYIETTMADTSVPNIVTAVLADYRGFDTLFETVVIFTAGIACLFLLRTVKTDQSEIRLYRHRETGITLRIKEGGKIPEQSEAFERIDLLWTPPDVIIKTTCRLIIPFMLLFALYVIAHGHHSPGGGFQGGVILGAAMILLAIAYDLRTALKRLKEKIVYLLCAAGVFIFAGTGVLCLLFRKNFLDYGALAGMFGVDPVTARSHGILMIEIGVGIAVMAVMVILYYNLSSAGRYDEGL